MPSFLDKHNAGRTGISKSGLGHLEGLHNNTHPQWWKDPCLVKLHIILMAITLVQITGGYDGSLINNLQALTSWETALGNPNANMIGVIGAVQTVGAVAVFLPAPWVNDKFGRKWSIVAGGLLITAGGFLQGFAYSTPQYIVGRMVVGAGNVFGVIGGSTLTNELAHPRTRPYIVGYYNVIWYIGSIIAAWLCYGLKLHLPTSQWGWRIPTLLMAFFGMLQIAILPWIPESPRWLMAHGREAEAHALLTKLHANGVEDDELVAAEILEIKRTFETEAAAKDQSKSWKQCFATPGDRWRMFICIGLATCNNWTGQSIVTYYNTKILTQAGITTTLSQLGINGGLSIFDLFCAIFGGFISGRVGRRPLFLASFLGMTGAHIIVTGLSARYAQTTIAGYGYAVIAFYWVESGFYNIAMNPLIYAYVSECLSYSTRAKGMSLFLVTGDWQAIITRYCNPIGLANLGWKYYIVFLAFYVLETAFIYLYFPETKGRTLEEIAEIFDGVQVANQVVAEIEKGHNDETKDIPVAVQEVQ